MTAWFVLIAYITSGLQMYCSLVMCSYVYTLPSDVCVGVRCHVCEQMDYWLACVPCAAGASVYYMYVIMYYWC